MAISSSTLNTIMKVIAKSKTIDGGLDKATNELGVDKGDYLKLVLAQGNMTSVIADTIIEPTIAIAESVRGTENLENIIDAQIDTFINLYTKTYDTLFRLYGLEPKTAITLMSSQNATMANIRRVSAEMGFEDLDNTDVIPTIDLEAFNNSKSDKVRRTKDEDTGDILRGENKKSERRDNNTSIEKDSIGVIFRKFKISLTIEKKSSNTVKNLDKDKTTYEAKTDTEETFVFEMLCKASVKYYPDREFLNLAKGDNQADRTFWGRTIQLRAGEIDWVDFFTGRDLLKKEKTARISANSSLIKELDRRVIDSDVTMAQTKGVIGFGRYYNIIIIDNRLQKQMESIFRGKFRKDSVKDRWLETFKSIIGIVVDNDFETVTTYVKNLSGHAELGISKYKSKNKNDNTDLIKFLMARGH